MLVSIAGLLGWVDALLVMAGWAVEPEKQLQVAHGRMDGLEDSMRDLMGMRQLTTDPTVTLGTRWTMIIWEQTLVRTLEQHRQTLAVG